MQKENGNKKVVNKISVILNLIQDLIRFLKRNKVEMLKRVQDDVFFYNNGFTLIELLVVVLIIGILAAVAVPQYQKAVEKSRAAQGLAVLRAVYEAQKAYHMANGSYATTLDELAVDVPWNGNARWSTSGQTSRSNRDWSLELYFSATGDKMVSIGRLRGKYAGGAFGFALESPVHSWPTDQLLCMERKAYGVIFEGKSGNYCKQLFKGTLRDDSNGAVRMYTMP